MHSDLSARTNDQSKLYHLRVKIKVKYTFTSDNQRHAWPSPVVIVTRKPLRERWSQTGRMMSKKGGFRPQRDWGNLGGRVTKREQISDVPPLRIEDVEGITFGTTCPRSEGRFYFSTQDFHRPHRSFKYSSMIGDCLRWNHDNSSTLPTTFFRVVGLWRIIWGDNGCTEPQSESAGWVQSKATGRLGLAQARLVLCSDGIRPPNPRGAWCMMHDSLAEQYTRVPRLMPRHSPTWGGTITTLIRARFKGNVDRYCGIHLFL